MAVKSENTMQEGMQSLMQDIAVMKFMPDADLNFLVSLETMIIGYQRQAMDQTQQQANPGMNMPPGAGMPPGGGLPPNGGMPPMVSGPMAGRGMVNQPGPAPMSPGPPPMDEMQRLMS